MNRLYPSTCIARTVAAFICLLVSTAATAVPVYDNGSYSESGAIEFARALAADDFVLASDETVTGVSLVVRDDAASPTWDGSTINWYVFADGGVNPGAVIDSGVGSSIGVASLGASVFAGDELLEVSFEFGAGLDLTAGTTYWLGLLFADTVGGPNGVQWLISDSSAGDTGRSSLSGPSGPWSASARDLNFVLQAAPVSTPASLSLLALGTILLLSRRRRATS